MRANSSGDRAEKAAAAYLEMRGFKIIERNWRRPRCEIDIIASKQGVLYFVEVKYRRSDDQGSGFVYITATKIKQMQRAAWMYVDETRYRGEYVLSAIELSGPDYAVISFVENVY